MSEETETEQTDVEALTDVCYTLSAQLVSLTQQLVNLKKRVDYYEAHVPEIRAVHRAMMRAKRDGIIMLHDQ